MTNTEHGIGETMTVTQAAAADEEAFDALYRRHGDLAWRLAVALTGDDDDAGAVVRDAFAHVFTGVKAARISPEDDFRTALLVAVRHAALDLARHQQAIDDFLPRTPSTHTDLLGRAFADLPERWRTTLWLTIVEDVAPGAVAPIVELSPHDTAQLAGRARRGLHEQFLNAHLAETGDRNCARAIPRLSAHAADELDEGDREKLDRHLGLCAGCAERRRQLDNIAVGLAALAPALPDEVREPTRIAWADAVAPKKERTATGLSATTEKLLAGVSAVAAAAGVVGAAMLGGGAGGRGASTASARPVSPAATDTDAPRPLELDPGVEIPSLDGGDLPVTGTGASSNRASGTSGSNGAASRSVFGASSGSDRPTTVRDMTPTTTTSPTTSTPPTTQPKAEEPPPAPAPPADEPVISIGTDLGGTPVAVDVGSNPGVTVGPISVGSQPQPTAGKPVELGGALAPVGEALAPVTDVVETVTDQVTKTLGGLGLGLGG